MSEHALWALEEMTRLVQADRLAEAAADRLAREARSDKRSLRIALADALRMLASRIDSEESVAEHADRRLARAC